MDIGEALDWNVAEGLQHLGSCEDCRAQLETLQLTRSVFVEAEPVDAAVLQRISAAVNAAAATELRATRTQGRATLWLEALLAGATGLIVLVSSGVPIDRPGTAALGFALGCALMVSGRWLARSWPVVGQGRAHV
jgi:hypothetical protein